MISDELSWTFLMVAGAGRQHRQPREPPKPQEAGANVQIADREVCVTVSTAETQNKYSL